MITYRDLRRFASFGSALILVGTLGLKVSASEQEECSLETLRGEYVVTGLAQARLDQREDPTFPRLHLGIYTFDGKGAAAFYVIANQGGHLARIVDGTGTYTVDAGRCVAMIQFEGAVFETLLVRDGSEGEMIRTDGPEGRVVISARHLKRRSHRDDSECSLATLRGQYQVNGPAMARLGQREDPTFPRVNIGNWDFDGNGNVLAFTVQNHGGQLIRAQDVVGTYTMDASRCVATVIFGTTIWEMILAGNGEGDAIRTDGSQDEVTLATRHMRRR